MTPSQRRASLILQVRAGQITAQEAARQLGISRQAYYKWESRVQELERQVRLHEERDQIRMLLKQMESRSSRDSTKKNSR